MHSSGMHTARLLTVSQHALHRGVSALGVSAQGAVCSGGCLPRGGVCPRKGVADPPQDQRQTSPLWTE